MMYSVYRLTDGVIISHLSTETLSSAKANTPDGCALVEGYHRADLYRVVDGNVIEWRPDAPDEHHEWHDGAKRWVLKPAVHAAREQRRLALERITALESSQHRAIREVALAHPGAVERLKNIDTEISALRQQLQETMT